MSSGFDDLVYWHFFTITVNYESSHIELLLNDLRLLSDEYSMKNILNSRVKPLYHCVGTEQRSPPPMVLLLLSRMRCLGKVYEPLPRKMDNSVSASPIRNFRRCLPSRCLANGGSGLARKCVLVSRCLALDYSGFQASCHNTYIPNWRVLFQSLTCLECGDMLLGAYSTHALSRR
jgi:hypothetical protein